MAAQRECLKLLDTKIDIYTRQLQQEHEKACAPQS
jgi:hypothetical protein